MRIFLIVTSCFFILPILVYAQAPTSLVDLVPSAEGEGIGNYINLLYLMSISLAALLAVVKIIVAGMKYMLSDVITTKGAALSDIQNTLLGLLLILAAVLILNTINPSLSALNITFNPVPMPDLERGGLPGSVQEAPVDHKACIKKTSERVPVTDSRSTDVFEVYDLSSCADKNKSKLAFREEICPNNKAQELMRSGATLMGCRVAGPTTTNPERPSPGGTQPPGPAPAEVPGRFSCITQTGDTRNLNVKMYVISACPEHRNAATRTQFVQAAINHLRTTVCKDAKSLTNMSGTVHCNFVR